MVLNSPNGKAVIAYVAGSAPADLPAVNGMGYIYDHRQPFSIAIALPGTDPAGFLAALLSVNRLTAPVLDFTGGRLPRADMRGQAPTGSELMAGLSASLPVLERLAELPGIPRGPDQLGLTMLALAYSRGTDLKAAWTPSSRDMVGYPLLAGIDQPRPLLEQMAAEQLLGRGFFDRVHVCDRCHSCRQNVREECPKCGSSNLEDDQLVNHYSCGYQAAKSTFLVDHRLICPKCRKPLLHYGVDYDTPGEITACQSCKHVSSEPEVGFLCLDCGNHQRGGNVATLDWYHYKLLPAGTAALTSGSLPWTSASRILSEVPEWRAPRELAILLDQARRTGERYHRPYQLMKIEFQVPPARRQALGAAGMDKQMRLVVNVIRENIRDTDVVTLHEDTIFLLLPETNDDRRDLVTGRLTDGLKRAIDKSLEIHPEPVTGERVKGVIERLMR